MARYIDAKCKLCRREGAKLFLKGERCFSPKCPIERKGAVPPGQHGQRRKRNPSDYGIQLREKQKTKRIYGVLEKQFKSLFKKAASSKKGAGLRLLQFLELRLDSVLFRGGLTSSRSSARQIITHGFCLVDGKKINIPSYQVKVGQVVTLAAKALSFDGVKKTLTAKQPISKWLKKKAVVLKVDRLPERDEIESNINEQLITEFYSR